MNCPRCGASTTQAPGGGWYCGNCGWQTGYVPPIPEPVLWLEAQPINAFEGENKLLRRELFDSEGVFRGGSVHGLYTIKDDHKNGCYVCSYAAGRLKLVIVG